MKEQLENRFIQLKEEFDNGRKLLSNLQRQEANLKETLLRISGAIQVIEEELNRTNGKKRESDKCKNMMKLLAV
jgi:chromosome segregation ATPase